MALQVADDIPLSEMVDLTFPQYSKNRVVEAGKVLKGQLPYDDGIISPELVEIFRVAHNWRDAHLLPMRKVRAELARAAKKITPSVITVARLKRMKSIRKKLARQLVTLWQMQDIGGARAIVDTPDEVNKLVAFYQDGKSKYNARREDDHIAVPKRGGYRSRHLQLKFVGEGEEAAFNVINIELQIRTPLQHAWATAVEAAGLVLRQDLKGGEGDGDWLRLFEIMSSEIAAVEGCPLVANVDESATARRAEILDLNQKLDGVKKLDMWAHMIKYTDEISEFYDHSLPSIYVIQYDGDSKKVTVRRSTQSVYSQQLIQAEEKFENRDTVVIETDKAEDLKAAYPNYFLDVSSFNSCLMAVVAGKKFAAPKRESASPVFLNRPKIDLSWHRNKHGY